MPASRHQDHTTWPSASRAFVVSRPKRPPPPAPNVRDDRETPLLIGCGMAAILPVIWGNDQPHGLRPINTTGKSGARAEIRSSERQLLATLPNSGAVPAHAGTHTLRLRLRQAARQLSTHYNDRWLWVPASAGTTANEAAITSIALDTPAPLFVNRTLLALTHDGRAHSSAGERSLHTGEVQGSIPCAPTSLQ